MFKGFVISTVRHPWRMLMLGAVGVLAACGGGGGGGDGDAVSITVTPSTIDRGESALLEWDASLYGSCTASGAWSGARPTTSGDQGVGTGVIDEAGTYTYTLTCSGGLVGSASSASATLKVNAEVAAPASRDCGIGTPTRALLAGDGASVAVNNGIKPGDLCLNCTINGVQNIITKDPEDELVETYASINTPVSFNKATEITVTGGSTYAAGRPAGFLISTGSQALLSGDARRDLTVQTLLNGTVAETYTTTQTSFLGYTTQPVPINQIGGEPFTIDIFGQTFSSVPNGTVTFIGFTATKPYNAIRIGSATKLSANELRVYAACAGAP